VESFLFPGSNFNDRFFMICFFVSSLTIRSFCVRICSEYIYSARQIATIGSWTFSLVSRFSPCMVAEPPNNQRKVCRPKFLFSYLISLDFVWFVELIHMCLRVSLPWYVCLLSKSQIGHPHTLKSSHMYQLLPRHCNISLALRYCLFQLVTFLGSLQTKVHNIF
jgi:hypothetical protein